MKENGIINNTVDIFSISLDFLCDDIFSAGVLTRRISSENYQLLKKLSQHLGCYRNLVMDVHKISYNNTLWDSAMQMWITNQTSDPQGNETTPQVSEVIYKASSAQEISRIQGNPYRIAYAITNPDLDGRSGNGIWGSLCWLMPDDTLINRVRTGVIKEVNKAIFVELNARID